jgi:tetratricopeptide (TPR) repeat protein
MNTNTEQLLPKAFSLHQAGNIVEAESLYRAILKEDAANPLVLSMLGMLCMQRGDWEEGIRLLQDTLEIDPNQPDTLSNLGYALQNLQRYDEALECYDKAIALFPDHVSAWYNRGNTLYCLERYQEAVDSFNKALAQRPNHANTCVNLGNAFNKLKQYDAALTNYIKALNLNPDDPGILNNLGLALINLKRCKEAVSYLNKAISLQPGYTDAYLNLAIALEELGRKEEALNNCDTVIALQPERADAHCRRGQILRGLMRHEEAKSNYQAAIALQPRLAAAHFGLGTLLMETGDNEAATASLLNAIEVDPECVSVFLNLAMLNRYEGDAALFGQLASLYAKRDAKSREDRIILDFAMGKAQEELEHYDEAFSAYEEGNSLYHADHPFAESDEESLLDSTTRLFTHELFEECRTLADALPAPENDRVPVFIVGMPRSGTTLIEQILASHQAVYGAGELEAVNEASGQAQAFLQNAPGTSMQDTLLRLHEIGQDLMARVWEQASDARFVTDKMPGNFRTLGLIHLMLPQAKIIHAMREPMDTCFSCYATNFNKGHHYSYDQGTLGRYYQRYRRMMEHWHGVLPADKIFDLRYEEIVADPEHHVRQLLEFLGLPWDPACLKFYENRRTVSTASVNQVRKPLYSSSVARWKRFEKHLGPLKDSLGELGST